MGLTSGIVSFKDILAELPRSEPVSSADLQARGVSAFRASALARRGWLIHVARGAYMLPGDTLTQDGALAFLSRQWPGLHVGGRTALAWRGVRQNLELRETLHLWGNQPQQLPPWFTRAFFAHYQSTQVFDAQMAPAAGLQPLPDGHPEVLVSVPERAAIELLSDVGRGQTMEEARQLVEGLPNLRMPILDEFLAHTTRIKVVRLAVLLADEFNHPWAALAKKHSDRLGGGRRWLAVSKSGQRLDLKRK